VFQQVAVSQIESSRMFLTLLLETGFLHQQIKRHRPDYLCMVYVCMSYSLAHVTQCESTNDRV